MICQILDLMIKYLEGLDIKIIICLNELQEAEGDEINPIITALTTMVQEYSINYILGTENKSFEEFRSDLEQFGMQKVVDTYQAAYDRYLAR